MDHHDARTDSARGVTPRAAPRTGRAGARRRAQLAQQRPCRAARRAASGSRWRRRPARGQRAAAVRSRSRRPGTTRWCSNAPVARGVRGLRVEVGADAAAALPVEERDVGDPQRRAATSRRRPRVERDAHGGPNLKGSDPLTFALGSPARAIRRSCAENGESGRCANGMVSRRSNLKGSDPFRLGAGVGAGGAGRVVRWCFGSCRADLPGAARAGGEGSHASPRRGRPARPPRCVRAPRRGRRGRGGARAGARRRGRRRRRPARSALGGHSSPCGP